MYLLALTLKENLGIDYVLHHEVLAIMCSWVPLSILKYNLLYERLFIININLLYERLFIINIIYYMNSYFFWR